MGQPKISSLSSEQLERICEIAEEAARKSILSKVPGREISDLSVSADLTEGEALNLEVDVEVTLTHEIRNANVKELAEEAVKAAFEAVEKYLENSG